VFYWSERFFAITQVPSTCLLFGTSKHRVYASLSGIESLAVLVLSLVLAQSMGLLGVAIAMSAPMAVVKGVMQPAVTANHIGVSLIEFHRRHTVRYLGVSFPLVILFSALFSHLLLPEYGRIFILALAYTAMFAAWIYFFGLSSSDRLQLRRVVSKAVGRGGDDRVEKNEST
jgi:hypothetical protein